ncbi:eCIS core domain-containing protein [Nonomuraea sp. NPDC003707]
MARTMTDDGTPTGTLGERLDKAGRQIAARHLPSYPWVSGLARVAEHVTRLTEPFDGRFERQESPVGRQDEIVRGVPVGDAPGASPSPASPGEASPPRPPAARAFSGDRTPTEFPSAESVRAPASAPGQALPPGVRSRLRGVAGPGADALRVHDDAAADTVARAHGADAVTAGADVYFRDGRLRPGDPAGFGLLAHEATHVTALLDPGGDWRRAAPGGVAAEERAALAQESAARHAPGPGAAPPPGGPPALPDPGVAPPAPAPATAPRAAAHPMTAPVGRDLAQQPPFDVEALRRSLIADLMRQLRTEFERGG